MEQHVPLGMVMALNVLPSKQPKIPAGVPTEGPCPVWSAAGSVAGGAQALETENRALTRRVAELEAELADARAC